MKHLRLVSSTTPSSVQDWLRKELEDRGIDSVYARSIISLLQQEYVDIEPHEGQHTKNPQLKVLHKYGGPDIYSAAKSRHQKGKKWGKQILSTFPPCGKLSFCDLEKIKKKTAVDWLRSASDYIDDDDIQELIGEVWIKLKNLKGDKEERRNVENLQIVESFFIPPSSPTNEIEKYFAAFPSLTDNIESAIERNSPQVMENAWWDRCMLKVKEKTECENVRNSEKLNIHISNKGTQPIIPYSSLKSIKNIYKIQYDCSSEIINYKRTFKCTKINANEYSTDTAQQKVTPTGFASSPIYPHVVLPLGNLFFIEITGMLLKKCQLLSILNNINLQDFLLNLNVCSFQNLAESTSLFQKRQSFSVESLEKQPPGNRKMSPMQMIPQNNSQNFLGFNIQLLHHTATAALNNKSINQASLTDIGDDTNHSFLQSFNADKELYTPDPLLKVHDNQKAAADPHIRTRINSTFKNIIQLFIGTDDIATASFEEMNLLISDENNCDINETYEDFIVPTNLSETLEATSNESAPKSPFLEEKNKCSISWSSNDSENTDDEIFFSDDDLNENFHLNDEENIHTTAKNVFQPIYSSSDSSELDLEIPRVPDISLNERLISGNFVSFIATNQDEKKIDFFIGTEENKEFEVNKEVKCKKLIEPESFDENSSLKISISDIFFSGQTELNSNKCSDLWFLYWADDQDWISRTWHKNSEWSIQISNDNIDTDMTIPLRHELNEEGDDLLKILCSYTNSSFTENQEMNKIQQNNSFSVIEKFVTKKNSKIVCDQTQSFTLHNATATESECPNNSECHIGNNNLESNFLEAAVQPELSAFSYDINKFGEEAYLEGIEWSQASDNFADNPCDNLYERSYSLGVLDLEQSDPSYYEYYQQVHCDSVSNGDEIEPTPCRLSSNYPSRHLKHTFMSKKRPCYFFLQGNCTQDHCKFLHDFSTITCRFWMDGSCFKGETCPFLHGYIEEYDSRHLVEKQRNLQKDIPDNNYSLESEVDFPSLSAIPPEEQELKSEPIDVVQVKRLRKNRRR